MQRRKIEKLIYEWDALTNEVIALNDIALTEVQRLFRETYNSLDIFSKEELVPKSFSKLLLEMNDFGWWVSDLDDTPIHHFYQKIISLVCELNKYFLTRDANIQKIEQLINETFAEE